MYILYQKTRTVALYPKPKGRGFTALSYNPASTQRTPPISSRESTPGAQNPSVENVQDELSRVIAVWSQLTHEVRAEILRLIPLPQNPEGDSSK